MLQKRERGTTLYGNVLAESSSLYKVVVNRQLPVQGNQTLVSNLGPSADLQLTREAVLKKTCASIL